MNKPLLIFAANHDQASFYATELHLSPKEYRYISNAQKLRGLPRGFNYIKVGTWYEHYDADNIEQMLKDRKAHKINIK